MKEPIAGKQVTRNEKWLLIVLAAFFLLSIVLYITLFHVNQFFLRVELNGEKQMDVEYGSSYEEPGSRCSVCTLLFAV